MTFNSDGSGTNRLAAFLGGNVVEDDTTGFTYRFSDEHELKIEMCEDVNGVEECQIGSLSIIDNTLTWVTEIDGCTALITALK